MSAKLSEKIDEKGVDCFTAWGLAAGEHAFYADSLGRFYFVLTRAILDHLKRGDIEQALILNFHVGLRCGGSYWVGDERHKSKHDFAISLSDPRAKKPFSLVRRISRLLDFSGNLTFAACSAAVVTEAYGHAKPKMRRFMSSDYSRIARLKKHKFEQSVMRRFAALAKSNIDLEIFHSAAELPLTAIYLRFTRPVTPQWPMRAERVNTPAREITELLAMGLYEPRHATQVVQKDKDLNLPVQLLVSGESKEDKGVRKQISCLVDVYQKHIDQPCDSRSDTSVEQDTVRVFLSHYGFVGDKKVVHSLKRKLELFAKSQDLNCIFIAGIGLEMSHSESTFYENLKALTHLIDYAIVLYPLKPTKRDNIPYELGVFSQRFMTRDGENHPVSSRAILVADPDLIVENFSNLTGIPLVPRPDANSGMHTDDVVETIFKGLREKIPFLNK